MRTAIWACAIVMLFLAFGGHAREIRRSRTIDVQVDDRLYTGYNLSDVPISGLVRLRLRVNDDDSKFDFIDGSGKVSTQGGFIAWDIQQNDKHRCQAATGQFAKFHQRYVALSHGLWQTAGSGAGEAPLWQVSVIQAKVREGLGNLPKSDKLLATARFEALAADIITPAGVPKPSGKWKWSYDGKGTFGLPDQPITSFTAGDKLTSTSFADQVAVEFKIDGTGHTSGDANPIDITSPKTFSSAKDGKTLSGGGDRQIDTRNPPQDKFVVLNKRVRYNEYDQFGSPITDSDFGIGGNVKIKEQFKCEGYKPMVDYFTKTVFFDANWITDNSGSILDQLFVTIPADMLIDKGRLVPELRHNHAVVLKFSNDGHQWFVSANETNSTLATRNSFVVTIESYVAHSTWDEFTLVGVYRVNVVNKR